jgi:DNA-binding HxlR family transcriptional regulator
MSKIEKRLQGCPVEAFLKIIGQRWNAYILHILLINGPLRFGILKKNIPGISQKVLTAKLRELESVKIIHRDYEETVPPKVTYSLTALGITLKPFLETMSDIAHSWRTDGVL